MDSKVSLTQSLKLSTFQYFTDKNILIRIEETDKNLRKKIKSLTTRWAYFHHPKHTKYGEGKKNPSPTTTRETSYVPLDP